MKKILAAVLGLTVIASTLLLTVSCGGGTPSTNTSTTNPGSKENGTIAGNCQWLDPHATAGSSYVEGVTVKVWDASDAKKGTSVSDASGLFSIADITPGTYTVTGHKDASTTSDGKKLDEMNWVVTGVVVTAKKTTSIKLAYQNSLTGELPAKYAN
jgi:hypothetical protein